MNAAIADELFAPDYVNHLVPGGLEAFKQFMPMLRSAAPDFKWRFDIERMVAEGDYVVVRFILHLTNAGKKASGSSVSGYRVVNGKIVEDWPPSDTMALLQQVGVSLPGRPSGGHSRISARRRAAQPLLRSLRAISSVAASRLS